MATITRIIIATASITRATAAMLLGKNEEERKEITNTMDLAYTIRNCIVHGSDYEQKLDSNKIQMQILTKNVENILRNSIQKLI